MAATELTSETSPEIELTATPQTSDQCESRPVSSPAHSNIPSCTKPATPLSQDSEPPTHKEAAEKECETILDASCTPQVCQQIEVVTEEQSCDPIGPQIDAVWSIGQEHSYEQKPRKVRELVSSLEPQKTDNTDEVADQRNPTNTDSDCDKENVAHTAETQHAPKLSCKENKVDDFVQTMHMPQIFKVKTKASKKYFIQDSADPGEAQPKLLTVHSTKPHTVAKKTHKALQVLKFPSPHNLTQPNLGSCHIDHNLKPLQIQHNLEHKKNKSKTVLQPETLSLKFQDESEDSTCYSIGSSLKSTLAKRAPLTSSSEKGILADVQAASFDYNVPDEEVSCDAVYLDIDDDSTIGKAFQNSNQMVQFENSGAEESIDSMLDNASMQNFNMDQYLADFTDLPQFQNISMDGEDDKCVEPMQLTPSIPQSVLSNDWQQNHASWYNPTSAQQKVDATLIPESTSLDEFVDGTTRQGGADAIVLTSVADGVNNTVPAGTSDAGSAQLEFTEGDIGALTQSGTAPVMTSAVIPAMIPSIKSEEQIPWNKPVASGQMSGGATNLPVTMTTQSLLATSQLPTTAGQTPASADQPENTAGQPKNMEGLPVGTTAPALSHDNSISGALMTVFDIDTHPSGLMELQNSVPLGQEIQQHQYLYPEDGTLGMGCSSTFLSPPPSVEQMASQCSTPCPDNESGYMTMDDRDLASPGNMYWQQHQQNHYSDMVTEDMEGTYKMSSQMYPTTMNCGYGGGGGYPYTHQDSHYQTLHQTASTSMATATTTNSNEIIYYPFNDLMQLNPSLLGSEQDASIQYVHPENYPQTYPTETLTHNYSDPTLTHSYHSSSSRKRGRGGRPRGGRHSFPSQIQSNQITLSLQHQLQTQIEAPTKRPYRRRNSNPDGRKKPAASKTPRSNSTDNSDKKGRHNEPLNQRAVTIMYEWYCQHEENPYPSKEEKEHIAQEGGISTMQVKSWFANKRNRSNNTRPKVQKRAMEEKLMQIYNQLSKSDGNSIQDGGNSFIIKELSQIIHNRFEPDESAV